MNLILLKKLLEAAAPSGFEERAVQVFVEEAQSFADKVYTDFYGNAYAEINPQEGKPFLLEAHIDEIGLMVSYVSETGQIHFHEIGGTDTQVYVGQRVRLLCPQGDLLAVVGSRPIHLIPSDERGRISRVSELYLDVGLSGKEAQAQVPIGTVGVIEQPPLFIGQKVVSKALDNRISVFCMLEALRKLKELGCKRRVVLLAAVQEEVGHHGAKIAAYRLDPEAAIAMDVTFETSQPQVEVSKLGPSPFESGANLCILPILHQGIRKLLEKTASDHSIPYTVSTGSSLAHSYTNADELTLTRMGVPTALIGLPCRYMHSPNEMVDLRDAQACIDLVTHHLLEQGNTLFQ